MLYMVFRHEASMYGVCCVYTSDMLQYLCMPIGKDWMQCVSLLSSRSFGMLHACSFWCVRACVHVCVWTMLQDFSSTSLKTWTWMFATWRMLYAGFSIAKIKWLSIWSWLESDPMVTEATILSKILAPSDGHNLNPFGDYISISCTLKSSGQSEYTPQG